MSDEPLTYEAAGVSIGAQDAAIAAFKDDVARSCASARFGSVLAGVGAFSAAFAPQLDGIAEPVLTSSTDGLGTKALLHARFRTFAAAGRDVVGTVVNDVLCSGSRPAFFLDYIGTNRVVPEDIAAIVRGIAEACTEIGCALIGGEIAEMRDVYKPGEFDLVGVAIGLADRARLLPHGVQAGDVIIGLPSSGAHANGFSLIRRALEDLAPADWEAPRAALGGCLRDVLTAPTRCYGAVMHELLDAGVVKAAAHISGGGLPDNLPRVLPAALGALIDRNKIAMPPVFDIIQRSGRIAEAEMWHVFNMGVGFAVVTAPENAASAVELCHSHGSAAAVIGEVVPVPPGASRCVWVA
jgi:phosphoribosylformylglycinamidine cyclo-ligase